MQPKFRLHHVDTRFGRVWRVVFPDGFAVRFTSWERAKNYVFAHADGKWGTMQRPVRSETTVQGLTRADRLRQKGGA